MSNIRKKIKVLPQKSGCYLFKNRAGKIIYVGKAGNIKKRVSSYFQHTPRDYKITRLLREVNKIDFIITSNEIEALLLEARLIKEHKPRYNVRLKSGVPYAYIKITNELFPRLESARIIKKTEKVFGPFVSAQKRKELIRLANIVFKLRSSSLKPRKFNGDYRIRISTKPWERMVTPEEYRDDIKKVILFLRGNNRKLRFLFEKEMMDFSKNQQYELAKTRRDQIQALKYLEEKQKMYIHKKYDQDVIDYHVTPRDVIFQIFNISQGIVSNKEEYTIERESFLDEKQILSDFVKHYYTMIDIPHEIIVAQKLQEQAIIEQYLCIKAGHKVRITIPQKGDKMKLLSLLKENISATLGEHEKQIASLQDSLQLTTPPYHIECFDISNLGSSNMVGAMVHFFCGKPDKNNYRRFKIKGLSHQSDVDAMKEILNRHYSKLKDEKKPMPDLIVVDGGRAQLNVALHVLHTLEIQAMVIALAKKFEEIYIPHQKNPLQLSRKSDSLKLLQRVRDEAHRFALKYHRHLRLKSYTPI